MNTPTTKPVDTRNLLRALKVGDRLQLCTPYDDDEHRYPVTLIGWLHDQSVIVTPPENVNWPLLLKRNQEYTIRLFSGTAAYAFATHVLLILDRPYEQVHLSYPAKVLSAPVRRAERLIVDVAAEVETRTDEIIRKAEIIDASALGARIRVADFGNVGDSIKVSFRLTAGGKEWPVSLSSVIRNKQKANDTNESDLSYFGLEFQSVDDDQALIITSFLYEQMTQQK